jgi:hypothetical protein
MFKNLVLLLGLLVGSFSSLQQNKDVHDHVLEETHIGEGVQNAPKTFNELELFLEVVEEIVLHEEFITVVFNIEDYTDFDGEYVLSYQVFSVGSDFGNKLITYYCTDCGQTTTILPDTNIPGTIN